jgi:hypothetical protein
MFPGVADPFVDDFNLANHGSFGNNLFNSSRALNPNGLGGYTNPTLNGLGRRRMLLGAEVIS